VSSAAIKKEVMINTPFRRIGWEDWALWIDLKAQGASAKFDKVIRYRYNDTPNSLSKYGIDEKCKEILNLKLRHKTLTK
jgi:hypothetical protein